VVTRAQAVAAGISSEGIRHRVRKRRWIAATRGVFRLAGAPQTPRQGALVAVFASGPGAVLSCASAAGLHGLPGFSIDPLTISVPRNGRRSFQSVRIEETLALPGHHVTTVDGIPCTTVARTLFDLCGDVHAGRAERALDTALSRKLVTHTSLCRMLDDLAEHGRAGTVLFRTLLEERAEEYVAPESELEARFIELTRRFGLPEPERQVDLGDDDGWIGRVDFLFRGARVVVEVDGAAFHDGLLDHRRDAERDERLVAAGWTVLRFRWDDVVDHPARVAQSIRFQREIASPGQREVAPERFWEGVRG
jgi:very-short-patch-repair endonuclease